MRGGGEGEADATAGGSDAGAGGPAGEGGGSSRGGRACGGRRGKVPVSDCVHALKLTDKIA